MLDSQQQNMLNESIHWEKTRIYLQERITVYINYQSGRLAITQYEPWHEYHAGWKIYLKRAVAGQFDGYLEAKYKRNLKSEELSRIKSLRLAKNGDWL